ncbi:MAG: flap endonuclease-1 [Thermoplasmata archaeon]|nr:flap endonuclease-1 [Thermoplasmata archaeon]
MGLPLRDLVRPKEIPWESLAGRTLSVDAYNAIYQFLATIRQRDGRPFTDPQGRPTSHLMGLLYRTTSLLSEGVLPVWVFDGRPPDLKAGTLRSRFLVKERAQADWEKALAEGDLPTAKRKAAATSRLTRPMAEEAKQLLIALGVPTVQAPSEGEAQASVMAKRGQVWGVASEDYDSLLFGAPRLVRGLAARGSRSAATGAHLIDRDELMQSLGLTDDELILVGILVGTDFNDGAKGYGPKRALQLVQQRMGWEATLRKAGLEPAEVEPVAELFRHPDVTDLAIPPFGPVDEAAVKRLLVEEHGFSEERVQAAIARSRRRPIPRESAIEAKGRQTLLDTFGGSQA